MSARALVGGERPPPSQLLRLTLVGRVRLRRSALDRRLAEGEDAAATPELVRRAEQLVSPKTRQALAAAIERLVDETQKRPRPLSAVAPLPQRSVLEAGPLLLGLAGELRGPMPVRPQGVALIRRLLTDGASPLYAPRDEQDLQQAIDEARRELLQSS